MHDDAWQTLQERKNEDMLCRASKGRVGLCGCDTRSDSREAKSPTPNGQLTFIYNILSDGESTFIWRQHDYSQVFISEMMS